LPAIIIPLSVHLHTVKALYFDKILQT